MALLAGCVEQKPSKVAIDLCSSIQNMAVAAFNANQRGADKQPTFELLEQSKKEGMADELYGMSLDALNDAYQQPKITNDQEASKKAREFSEKHFKACLSKF